MVNNCKKKQTLAYMLIAIIYSPWHGGIYCQFIIKRILSSTCILACFNVCSGDIGEIIVLPVIFNVDVYSVA